MKTSYPTTASHAGVADTYGSFHELAANRLEGTKWSRELHRGAESDLAHLAIHGGAIEPGTTEVARAA